MTQKYARIVDDAVFETFSTDLDIADLFSPDLVWVACSDAVEQGYSYNGTNFAPPVPVTPPAPPAVKPTPREWIRRLSVEKRLAVASAIRASDELFMMYSDLMGALSVDVSDPDTITAVGAFRAAVPALTDEDQAALLAP